MRMIFCGIVAAVLCTCSCIENKPAEKSKRQLNVLRSPENHQYSIVLPHSRVSSYKSIGSSRLYHPVRVSRLPPYAVPMEPIVQYSQKDPLYDHKIQNFEDNLHDNKLQAQSKILVGSDDQELHSKSDHISQNVYGSSYFGSFPSGSFHHNPVGYYPEPEPIIEIIIKESNESLPISAQPLPQPSLKKDPIQVFYVKYAEDPHSGKLIYEKPVPAVTPPSNVAEHHKESYVTVTPEPQTHFLNLPTTTLRTIIKPESEVYHSDSGVKVTFGSEDHHHHESTHREDVLEGHEETAPEPSLALPRVLKTSLRDQTRVSFNDQAIKPLPKYAPKIAKQVSQFAQQRIQYNSQPYNTNDQALPNQHLAGPGFRGPHVARQGSFGPPNSNPQSPLIHNTPFRGPPSSPPFRLPTGPSSFHSRPISQLPNIGNRPSNFHQSQTRPFHSGAPNLQVFNEPKYLQENYHTITTEQVQPLKDVQPINSNQPNFNFVPRPQDVQRQVPSNQNQRPHGEFQNYHQFQNSGPSPLQQLPQQKPIDHFDSNRHTQFPASKQNLRPTDNFHSHNTVPQTQPAFSFHPSHSGNQAFNIPQQALPRPTSIPPFQTIPPANGFQQQPHQSHQSSSSQAATFVTPVPQNNQHNNFRHQNDFHQQNVGSILPQGGELVASIPKYEQHIVVSGPGAQPNYQLFGQQTGQSDRQPTNIAQRQAQRPHQPQPINVADQEVRQQTHTQNHNHEHQAQFSHNIPKQTQNQNYNHDQQIQAQLALNVKQQQEEIRRLQAQLQEAQNQQRAQASISHHSSNDNEHQKQYSTQSPRNSDRSKSQQSFQQYSSSTNSPFYQTTSRTISITPTTTKYSSSTATSVNPNQNKVEKKKPQIELPDEVPDDLRQQLLSSGILDNADISVLDYDKVGDTPLDSLPPDQLANFFSAGGAQQISGSENKPVVVNTFGDRIQPKTAEVIDDQEASGSETVASYVLPPSNKTPPVEMKVVHFDPSTKTGQEIAENYVQEGATQVDPVALNDKKYNRYLPLKVKGNQFPVPDFLRGKKVTSVVVLAPVQTENLKNVDHSRNERATENNLKGINFVAGESLQKLLKDPTTENFNQWLDHERNTPTSQQSIVLLVVRNDGNSDEKEIFMYDLATKEANKLSGELSSAFVEAAETNSIAEDIEKIAIADEGTPENLTKQKNVDGNLDEEEVGSSEKEADDNDKEAISKEDDAHLAESKQVPSYVSLSHLQVNDNGSRAKVSITSGYSKMKHGSSQRKI